VRGISTRKTSLGWTVIRVHYSADEDKDPKTPRGKAWYDEARRGMSDARFRKEFEIDYGALGGQLLFPDFDESIHVLPLEKQPCAVSDLSAEQYTVFLGCDPHIRAAHAFVWLAVNREGEMAIVWSWWPGLEDKRKIEECVVYVKAMSSFSACLRPRRMVMDVAAKGMDASEERNYFQEFQAAGLTFQPSKKNRDEIGDDLLRQALAVKPYGEGQQRPKLTIWDKCGDNAKLVWQLKNARYQEFKGNVTDKDPPEKAERKERHLIDCIVYILLYGARFIPPKKIGGGDWEPIYPGGKSGGTGY